MKLLNWRQDFWNLKQTLSCNCQMILLFMRQIKIITLISLNWRRRMNKIMCNKDFLLICKESLWIKMYTINGKLIYRKIFLFLLKSIFFSDKDILIIFSVHIIMVQNSIVDSIPNNRRNGKCGHNFLFWMFDVRIFQTTETWVCHFYTHPVYYILYI